MRLVRLFTVACLLIGFVAIPVQAEESLEEAASAITAAWDKIEALEADMQITATAPMGTEVMKLEGTGHVYYLRDGDTAKYRQEMTIKLPPPVEGESKHTSIFNGKELFLINETMGQVEVQKADIDFSKGAAPPGGKPLLDALGESLELKRLPDTELEGTPVYVIEGTPKAGSGADYDKVTLYVDKDYGVQRKIEIASAPGKPSVTMAWTTLKHNPEIDPKVFDYTGKK